MNMIIIGFGNVGQSLAEMLELRAPELRERYGLKVNVVAIVDRGGAALSEAGISLSEAVKAKRFRGSVSTMRGLGRPQLSALEVLEEVDGDIVIEVTSTSLETGEPGLTHIKKAISSKKHVVTTSKGALAQMLPDLIELANKNDVSLMFSGAVGGAMPILDFAKMCLRGEKVESLRGVLNGTTNYILWRMAERRIGLSQAVREAQELGYAEENVSYDLNGLDTACKLVILANWVMNRRVSLKDVETRGIEELSLEEVLKAKEEGFAVRLIGSIKENLRVRPERVSLRDPLCVDSSLNAVVFTCRYSGQHVLIGRGAGGKETASAVIRDVLTIAQGFGWASSPKDVLNVNPKSVWATP